MVLSEHQQRWGTPNTSSTLVAWIGYSEQHGYENKLVHIHDIQASHTRVLESTLPGSQYGLKMWEERLVWQDNRRIGYAYNIYFHDAGSDEGRFLSETDFDQCGPGIWRHLVTWTDFRRTGYTCDTVGQAPADLMIHDLETGVSRRVYQCPNNWNKTSPMEGYMIYYIPVDGYTGEHHLMNLEENGILDSDLHVIPDPESDP